MRKKLLLLLIATLFVVAGCSSKGMDNSITLQNHENNDVSFPQEKPVLFFFITTYT
ncbi:hypothetical protein [Cytobacillus purgationiresistens]|uniref:Protein involved in sex pheromone biosynthesis n=1 Tax=Cytobacillus purgationiresistens TaxID=863449 RepID=A0ABU0AAK4_9BACI|nr:hypothetical protein [Cytobacillus purgationiresistens]MDQ0268277.1 protein involved in sex pheromone biosynthesis [Cytobacillus purgationiresistens]